MASSAHDISAANHELLRERDHAAIESLVRAHTETLYRAACGLGFDKEASRELVQRVWCTFLEVVPSFKGHSSVRTFLFGILYNKGSEMRRQLARVDAHELRDEFMDDRFQSDGHYVNQPIDPERFSIAAQTMEFIRGCLDRLPLSQRMVFWMREVDGANNEDVCGALSISLANLRVLLCRARNGLRECLESKA